ncbi:MAG: TadE family protein [Thermoleophilia bacterium]|nr:TadE family protein [Thermoleophilia bacterium]
MTNHHDSATGTPEPEAGQAMVEFALVLPVLCVLLFGIVEFGLAFWHYQMVSAAASEGARRGAISRTASDRTSRVIQTVKDSSPQLDPTKISTTVTSTWAAGSTITVNVSYPQTISIMGVTLFNSNLTGKRTMRVEQ